MPKKSLKERFNAKVKVDGESDCWIWTGSKTHAGYGRISVEGKPRTAIRVAYEIHREPIPKTSSSIIFFIRARA
jgi:hypothetical protein